MLAIMKPENFTGCAESQTGRIPQKLRPVLDANKEALGMTADINV